MAQLQIAYLPRRGTEERWRRLCQEVAELRPEQFAAVCQQAGITQVQVRLLQLLVNRYRQPLVSCVRGFLKDDEQVNDVLQYVFLRLYLSLPILLRNVPLKAWLFQVARNRCLDELRKRHRRAEISFSTLEWKYREEEFSPLEAIPDPEPLPQEVVERSDLQCSLQQALFALPPKVRSIVHLHCFRHLSFAEIGRTLNMSKNTVKTSYYRSLPHLRRAMVNNVHVVSIS